MEALLQGYSIEVMPRTAAKVEDFRALLPEGTRVYIAHIEGTPIDDMVATAKRLNADGYRVMPHFPARIIKDKVIAPNSTIATPATAAPIAGTSSACKSASRTAIPAPTPTFSSNTSTMNL